MKLNYQAPLNIQTSYGILSLEILKQLVSKGIDVSSFPIGGTSYYKEDEAIVMQSIYNQENFDRKNPSLKIFHQNLLAEHVSNTFRIGFPIFELNKFSNIEKAHLNSQDILFVASQWAQQVIYDNGVKVPTHIVPLGVDRFIFNENVRSITPKTTATRFINIGKIEKRKGILDLVGIFNKAFTPKDNVQLIMIVNNLFSSLEEREEIVNLYLKSPLGNKIQFIGLNKDYIIERIDISVLRGIITSCDCSIFPSRAEGWNMPALECLSCGLHNIITNYSASTEFCNSDNSYLCHPDKMEIAVDNKWFHGNIGEWVAMTPNLEEQFIQGMRFIHNKKQHGSLKLNQCGIETAKQFSWSNTADKIIQNCLTSD